MKGLISFAALQFSLLSAAGLGTFEFEAWIPDKDGGRHPVALVIAAPDSIAGVHPLAVPRNPGPGTLLPGGKPSLSEREFAEGLRAFVGGNFGMAGEKWAPLQMRRLPPPLRSCVEVNAAVLRCLRGETAAAESVWTREWKQRAPAAEAAWRNLLGTFLALRRFREANRLLDAVLREHPRSRVAASARAALLRHLRPDSEWEAFLEKHSAAEDSLPEIQLNYGEFLVGRGRWAEAVPLLDRALAALPGRGRGWRLLAEAQYRLGYHVFAEKCLANAVRSGYRESDLYELYALVLNACCGGDEEQGENARRAAERLLEEGLPKDLHRRSMAQFLYRVYCRNGKPDAARELERSLWFHFEGPRQGAPALGTGVNHSATGRLRIRFGIHDFAWITALRDTDFFRAF